MTSDSRMIRIRQPEESDAVEHETRAMSTIRPQEAPQAFIDAIVMLTKQLRTAVTSPDAAVIANLFSSRYWNLVGRTVGTGRA